MPSPQLRIDLHTHSDSSDGTDSPTELMWAAAEAGLDVVALTDHDTTLGWAEAAAAVDRTGVGLVRGVEISCKAEGVSVHLLSYLHDPGEPVIAEELERSRTSRLGRGRAMVDKIAEDYPITWDSVCAQASPGATIGRPHIADALVAAGVVPDRAAAFDSIVSSSSRYYVRYHAPEAVEMVERVRAAGGVPVIAHPYAASRGRVVSEEAIGAMAEAGLFGLEIDHSDHTPHDVAALIDLANRLDLARTGSSDYHGRGKPNRLGENLTDPAVLEWLADEAGLPVLWP